MLVEISLFPTIMIFCILNEFDSGYGILCSRSVVDEF